MSTVWNILGNQNVQGILIGLIALGWGAIKGSDAYQKWLTDQKAKAVLAVEAAVVQTYLTFVQPAKRASATGSLTTGEKAEARDLASRAAVEFGKDSGVDVKATLGDEYLLLYIQQAVARAKRGGV